MKDGELIKALKQKHTNMNCTKRTYTDFFTLL